MSATLSSRDDDDGSNIYDTYVNITNLVTNIKFVSKVVEKLMFNIPIESQISVVGENGVSVNYVRMILNTLAKTPRMFPHFLKDPSSKQVIDFLEKVFLF